MCSKNYLYAIFFCLLLSVAMAQDQVNVTPATLTLIDANINRSVGELQANLSYITIRSSSHLFNIEYKPPSSDTGPNYQSTRFTFDTYNRSYCDTTPPYLLYGFANGTTYGREFFLGKRYLTATPYTGLKCTGTVGPTLHHPFTVSGCLVDFVTKRLATRKRIFEIPEGAVLSSHPCNETIETYKLNMKARVWCGFPIKQVKIELYNNTADGRRTLVAQNTSFAYPYYLFGYRVDYLPGANVRPGNYTLVGTINNIPHPPVNFSILEKCFNYTAIHA
jgi:hypothetical protein